MVSSRDVCRLAALLSSVVIVAATAGCLYGTEPSAPHPAGQNPAADRGNDVGFPAVDTPGPTPLNNSTPTPSPTPVPTPAPRPAEFTVHVEGGKDHKQGETLHLYGTDTSSGVVYLFVTGTLMPIQGGSLADPGTPVVDQEAGTFVRVNVSENGTWSYDWSPPANPSALLFDLYNVIAETAPRDGRHLDDGGPWDLVAVKVEPGPG